MPRGRVSFALTLSDAERAQLESFAHSRSLAAGLVRRARAILLSAEGLRNQEGAVRVDGRDTRAWNPIHLRRRTGYVLQEIGLFPHLSVADNVTLVPRLEGVAEAARRQRAADLLELVGLPAADFADRWPRELSGGQRQRVGVARALAASPPVLLLDEPFGALDAITRGELQRTFQRIQRELRQTALLVTHDIAEAFALGTRVGVLDAGRLAACDTPAAIAQSTDPHVRQFLDALPPNPAAPPWP